MQSELFCSLEDAAKAYGVTVPTVRYWCRKGAIDGAFQQVVSGEYLVNMHLAQSRL